MLIAKISQHFWLAILGNDEIMVLDMLEFIIYEVILDVLILFEIFLITVNANFLFQASYELHSHIQFLSYHLFLDWTYDINSRPLVCFLWFFFLVLEVLWFLHSACGNKQFCVYWALCFKLICDGLMNNKIPRNSLLSLIILCSESFELNLS